MGVVNRFFIVFTAQELEVKIRELMEGGGGGVGRLDKEMQTIPPTGTNTSHVTLAMWFISTHVIMACPYVHKCLCIHTTHINIHPPHTHTHMHIYSISVAASPALQYRIADLQQKELISLTKQAELEAK